MAKLTLFVYGFLFVCGGLAQDSGQKTQPGRIGGVSGETWSMKGETSLHFESDGLYLRLVDRFGITIVRFDSKEIVRKVILSDDHTKMLILAMTRLSLASVPILPTPHAAPTAIAAFNYSRVVLVSVDGAEHFAHHSLFEKANAPMNERCRWISEIQSISDDGKFARVKLGQTDDNSVSGTMHYEERTIDLWQFDPFETATK
jgi:hypothetical protein